MDEQILQLMAQLSQAKGGNKNLSGLMGNLDNPLLLALAGAIDPLALEQSSGGGLYNQYANDPNTPDAVRAIMDYLDQGANKYQIQSELAKMPSEVITQSGYTPEMLDALASDMYSQRQKGEDKNVFAKAGFRNPSEVYTAADVPLGVDAQLKLAELRAGMKEPLSALSREQQRGAKARQQLGEAANRKDVMEVLSSTRNLTTTGGARKGITDLLKWMEKEGYSSGNTIKEAAGKFRPSNRSDASSYDIAVDTASNRLARKTDALKDKNPKRRKAIKDWEASKMKEAELSAEASNNARLQAAIRESALERAAVAGRTPFTDQASQLLRFISGSK